MKKKMNRRTFGKLAAGAALAGAAAKDALAAGAQAAAAATAPASTQAPQEGASRAAEPRIKMTPEQEEAVKQAVQRREPQLNRLRNFKMDYSVEPAFVFKVRK